MRLFCGARTRRGGFCQQPPVRGRRRCRMHGGNNRGAGALLVWRPGFAAAWKARRAYIERRHALGLKVPGGRPHKAEKVQTMAKRAIAIADAVLEQLPVINKP